MSLIPYRHRIKFNGDVWSYSQSILKHNVDIATFLFTGLTKLLLALIITGITIGGISKHIEMIFSPDSMSVLKIIILHAMCKLSHNVLYLVYDRIDYPHDIITAIKIFIEEVIILLTMWPMVISMLWVVMLLVKVLIFVL